MALAEVTSTATQDMDQTETTVSNPPRGKGVAAHGPGGASKHLAGLPSRGFFSAPVLSSNTGGMRVYVCDHETALPEDQFIRTNTTNILIRALQINKQKSESKDVTAKSSTASSSDKRIGVRTSEGRGPTKRMKTDSASTSRYRGASSSEFSDKTLQTMTVEKLRALLKDRGLSPKGKKEELIARLRDAA